MSGEINWKRIEEYSKSFETDPRNILAMNAVTKNDVQETALSKETLNKVSHTYSNLIKTGTATAQGMTGRCWVFAGLNMLRIYTMKKLNLKEFEFSQTYMMFWDPLDSRIVMWLLNNIVPDAGQWDMFVNLVKKYGVVPKEVMPETKSSMASRLMNRRLQAKLREIAKTLRDMNDAGASIEQLRQAKDDALEEYYRMICIHLGTPPTEFNWQWRDKDNEFHRHGMITPKKFYEEYVGFDLDQMVCLINAPTKDKSYNKMYTVQYLGNVVGGRIIRYLNVPSEVMVKGASEMVKEGKPVWFGADAGKMSYREQGVFDMGIYDYDKVYGTEFKLDKAARLDYGYSKMTHAMVFTGVDIDETENPRKWRVENSWGTKVGDKGFYTMSDKWFREYVYEVMIDRSYLPKELLAILDTEPVKLNPWDPMGALAK